MNMLNHEESRTKLKVCRDDERIHPWMYQPGLGTCTKSRELRFLQYLRAHDNDGCHVARISSAITL